MVARVARKVEERECDALFTAVGHPSLLFEECFAKAQLHTAAKFVLVIHRMHGLVESQRLGTRLLQVRRPLDAHAPAPPMHSHCR